MILTPDDLKNLNTLISVGAKTLTADKMLQESVMIQNIALTLLQKLEHMNDKLAEDVPESTEVV